MALIAGRAARDPRLTKLAAGATIVVALCLAARAAEPPGERELRRSGQESLCGPGTTVGEIRIVRINVFDPASPGENRSVYRFVNALHSPNRTREATIRRVLTIREGDPCTTLRLDEAERDLRRFEFLQDAWVDPVARDGDKVSLLVRVRDAWSTRLSASFNSQGGTSTTSIRLFEENLLGTGTSLGFEQQKDQDRLQRIIDVHAPALTPWRVVFDMELADNSDGHRRVYKLERPFWELADRYMGRAGSEHIVEQQKVYVGPDIVDVWSADSHNDYVTFGWSPRGLEDDRVTRWYVGLNRRQSVNVLAPGEGAVPTRPDLAPRDYDILAAQLSWTWDRVDFRRVQFINRAVRVEDLDLGTSVGVALSLDIPGGSRTTGGSLSGYARRGFDFGTSYAMVASTFGITVQDGDWYGAIVTADGRWYKRITQRQTIFVRGFAGVGNRLEGPQRFLLGGDTGLRGYRSRAFSGENELLAVFEDRWFAPWEWFHVIRPGFVGFVEAGGAWDGKLGWDDLHPDIGIGLRLAVLRSSHGTTLHFNLAKPLDPNGDPGHNGVHFSFLTLASF